MVVGFGRLPAIALGGGGVGTPWSLVSVGCQPSHWGGGGGRSTMVFGVGRLPAITLGGEGEHHGRWFW